MLKQICETILYFNGFVKRNNITSNNVLCGRGAKIVTSSSRTLHSSIIPTRYRSSVLHDTTQENQKNVAKNQHGALI